TPCRSDGYGASFRLAPRAHHAPRCTRDFRAGTPVADAGESRELTEPGPSAQRSERDSQILRALADRIDPRDAGAHNNLGVVYFKKRMLEEAIDAFERALQVDPRMGVAERNLRIAYFHDGYIDRLTAELELRLTTDPEDGEARRRLARACQRTGDYEAAVRHWSGLVERSPADPETTLALARAQAGRGDREGALRTIEAARARGVRDARLELQGGEILYHLARPAEARSRLERALELDSSLAAAHHLLAFVYGDIGLAEEAAASAARAEELNPTYGRAEANLSLDAYNTARYEELVGQREETPELAQGGLAHYNLGLAFRQRGLLAEAEREFDLAAARGEDALLVRQAHAELHLLRGDGAQALPLYDAAIDIEPGSPKLWNERGVAAHQIGDLEGAERGYRKALELDGSYVLAANNLAVVRAHSDDPAEAERVFGRALDEPHAPAEVWRNHALTLTRTGRHEAAEKAYRAALQHDADSAAGWAGLGTALLAIERMDEARSALVHAVQLDPELAEARYQLAFALSALGDYQGALRETRLALELDPLFPAPRFRLLIDLHFEEAGVPAPELAAERRVAGEGGVEEFRFESEALADVFESLQRPAAETASPTQDRTDADTSPSPFVLALAEGTAGDPATAAVAATPEGVARSEAAVDPARQADRPADPLAVARRALARGDLHEVHGAARAAAERGAPRAEVLLVRAEAFLRQGFAGEALERFDALLAVEAGDDLPEATRIAAELGRARSLLQLDRAAEALLVTTELAGARDAASALRVHGQALAANGRPAEAAEALERALEEGVEDRAGAALDAGHARLASGQGPDAERLFRLALSLEPDSPAAMTGLGRALAAVGREEEATATLRAALEALPSYADAAITLARLLRRTGDPSGAIATLADFLSADPYHLDGLHRLGEYLAAQDRVEDAATAFRRVLAFDPGHARARDALDGLGVAPRDVGAA
ncbi:MAG: tetratricopeptide repeat protein, partial [Gemmatimonadota bacterium]